MNSTHSNERLAICSWSLQPTDPHDLAVKMNQAGIQRVQLALDPLVRSPAVWGDTGTVLQQAGITIVSGMFGCIGEDYSTLDTIRITGGIAPDETWEQNVSHIRAIVPIAVELNLNLVTFHAGFVPHSMADPAFVKMSDRLRTVAELFSAEGLVVGLETGQETAAELVILLNHLQCSNLVVNFDPANMLLYAKGDPIEAIRGLNSQIRQVHIKDANASQVPGKWGAEVIVGTGQVDWPRFFGALREMNYNGDLVIEREAGTSRVADIQAARAVVLSLI